MAWEILRTVVEEHTAAQTVDRLTQAYPRFEEAWEGLKWLLARNPVLKGSVRKMVGTEEYRLYVLAGDAVAKTPDLWVVYTHTDAQITVLDVEAREQSDDQAAE